MAGYINGRLPSVITTLNATVSVETPYIQQGPGAHKLAVPNPANDDTLVVLSGVQTLSSKTILQPVVTSGSFVSPTITSGSIGSPTITAPAISSGTWVGGPIITTADIRLTGGGTLTGGIMHNVVVGNKAIKTQVAGATKTLDFSTADIFIVLLTGACTLTISNAASSKAYTVVVKQDIVNSYTDMSWMTGFVNAMLASGPTYRTGAIDFWQVFYNATDAKHYAIGAKDVQG